MKKIIGVTPRVLTESGTEKQFVNSNYVSALLEYDVNVIMITLDNHAVEEILSLCDGFLITGGSDLDPELFGEKNNGESEEVNSHLDTVDKVVVDYAVKHHVPLLGICRGHQSINVFLGGTLYQHIGTSHRGIKGGHTVRTIKNNYLDFDDHIITNSYHHQAVKDVAPNMKAIAFHEDGTVEAIIHNTLPIIGIQWHPERLPESKESKTIFNKFMEFVMNFRK